MLRLFLDEGLRTGGPRPVTLFYANRSKADRALDGEIAHLAKQAGGAARVVRVLCVAEGAREGLDYEALAGSTRSLLAKHLAFGDYDFHLCGPTAFVQSL